MSSTSVLEPPAPPAAPSAPPAPSTPRSGDSTPPTAAAPPPGHLSYRPGLDGLRAVAVVVVILYHAGVAWMPGGFLGVDVFFVISGYLITSLLLDERRRTGRVKLGHFWLRRARRLLPAVAVVIVASLVACAVFVPGHLAATRLDALASLFYVQNWHLIFEHQSYFASFGRPPLLQHLWSLSVEEQFYVVWPPLLAVALAAVGRRRVAAGVAAAAGASALLMALLVHPGADPSRVYYGTDTRAFALLAGCLLAFAWHPSRLHARVGRRARDVLDGVGLAALAGLAFAFVHIHDFDAGLYPGGLILVALAATVVVAILAHPAARLGSALGTRPLRWLGARSYGIYLWHWPVIVLTRPPTGQLAEGLPLLVGQVALTLALAAASYRFVEQPIRRGRAHVALDTLRAHLRGPRRRLSWGLTATAGAATAALLTWTLFTPAPAPAPPAALAAVHNGAGATASGAHAADRGRGRDAARAHAGRRRAGSGVTTPVARRHHFGVLAVGDSVMLGTAAELRRQLGRQVTVNAVVGRQPSQIVAVLAAYRQSGQLPDQVVVQIGNNGPPLPGDFERLRATLEGVPRVVLLTVREPRRWQDEVNAGVRKLIADWPQAQLADWYSETNTRNDLFVDGVHTTSRGGKLYAATIAAALERARAADHAGPRGSVHAAVVDALTRAAGRDRSAPSR